ncbi:MAG: hypothetical protein ACI4IL_06920 [Eubacterium sp.]
MKKVKKIFCSLLSLIICSIIFANTMCVFASDNIGVSTNPNYLNKNIYSTYSVSIPSKIYNLGTSGKYEFQGEAYSQDLYSNYLFTGVSKVKIHVENNYKKRLKVQLKEKKSGINPVVSTQYVEADNMATYTVSVDSSKKYYIRFVHECVFEGYIVKA